MTPHELLDSSKMILSLYDHFQIVSGQMGIQNHLIWKVINFILPWIWTSSKSQCFEVGISCSSHSYSDVGYNFILVTLWWWHTGLGDVTIPWHLAKTKFFFRKNERNEVFGFHMILKKSFWKQNNFIVLVKYIKKNKLILWV